MLDALVAEARLRWGLDLAAGLQVVASERLIASPVEASRPLLLVPLALLHAADEAAGPPEPLPGRHGPDGRDGLGVLRRLYPGDHPVGRFGAPEATTVAALAPADLAGPLYLRRWPPRRPSPDRGRCPRSPSACAGPMAARGTASRPMRRCATISSRRRTRSTTRSPSGPTPALADELGDLWLQVVLHAQLAAEAGVFDLADVQAAIASKIVRRHPHVFGDAEARTASDVNRQWERIKAAERAAAHEAAGGDALDEERKSALDGISRSLPALAASQEMQERAANLGYDWPDLEGVLGKVDEELAELRAAETPDERAEELGDLLFVLVAIARKLGVESEASLRAANDKFRRRFRSVERQAAERGVALRDLDFEALDALWDRAKEEEKAQEAAR